VRKLPSPTIVPSKSPSPKIAPSEFGADFVSTLRSILDAAVDQIDVGNRTPATKAKMAQRILRAASDGITDPATLTAVAIEDGMQPAA
jgi:hypothetical protein